jgi:hypothetical protein
MLQILSNLITIFEHLNQLKAHHSQTPMNSLYNTNFNPIAIMKFLTPTVLILTSAKAENLQSSEWGHIPTKRNLRVGRIRRNLSDMSISMSMPGDSIFSMSLPMMEEEFEQFEFGFSMSLSMSLPAVVEDADFEEFGDEDAIGGASLSMSMNVMEDADFEQFGADFGSSLSMSIPEEEEFEQFEDAIDYSVSMSMPIIEESDFEQFGADFGSLSMSIPEEDEFGSFEDAADYSVSMSMPAIEESDFEQFGADLGSLSMSIPEEEEFEQFEDAIYHSVSMSMPELEQLDNGFGESEPKETASDDFFFMPIFDDRSDIFKLEEVDEPELNSLSLSMSMGEGDLAQWAMEEDFDFLEINEFSVSMSMSMP